MFHALFGHTILTGRIALFWTDVAVYLNIPHCKKDAPPRILLPVESRLKLANFYSLVTLYRTVESIKNRKKTEQTKVLQYILSSTNLIKTANATIVSLIYLYLHSRESVCNSFEKILKHISFYSKLLIIIGFLRKI